MRRPDTLSTISSSLYLEPGPDEVVSRGLDISRILVEGYFGMPCENDDWPSLTEVQKHHSCPGLIIWLHSLLLPEPAGFLDFQTVAEMHPVDVPKAELHRLVGMVNMSWQAVYQYTELECQMLATQDAIMRQANAMSDRLSNLFTRGELNEEAVARKMDATEKWRQSKLRDVADQLEGKKRTCLESIHNVLAPTLDVFKMVDRSPGNPIVKLAQRVADDLEPVPEEMQVDEDQDLSGLLQELDEGVQKLTLQDRLRTSQTGILQCL